MVAQDHEAFHERVRDACLMVGDLLSKYNALSDNGFGWLIYDTTSPAGLDTVGGTELLVCVNSVLSADGTRNGLLQICTNEPIDIRDAKHTYITQNALVATSGHARYYVDVAVTNIDPAKGSPVLEPTSSPLFGVHDGKVVVIGTSYPPLVSAGSVGGPDILPFGDGFALADRWHALNMIDELLEITDGQYPKYAHEA